MDIIDAVLNLGSIISNWFGILIKSITTFFNNIVSVLAYILSIFKSLWFGLISLLSGLWNLIVSVFDGGVFSYIGSTFTQLIDFIGVPAVVFLSSLLLIAVFRIGLAFVFKIFRLNLDKKEK